MSDTAAVRMSRKAGGGKSRSMETCFHGAGEKGNGSRYSGKAVTKGAKPGKLGKKSKSRAWGKTPDPEDFFIRGFTNL